MSQHSLEVVEQVFAHFGSPNATTNPNLVISNGETTAESSVQDTILAVKNNEGEEEEAAPKAATVAASRTTTTTTTAIFSLATVGDWADEEEDARAAKVAASLVPIPGSAPIGRIAPNQSAKPIASLMSLNVEPPPDDHIVLHASPIHSPPHRNEDEEMRSISSSTSYDSDSRRGKPEAPPASP